MVQWLGFPGKTMENLQRTGVPFRFPSKGFAHSQPEVWLTQRSKNGIYNQQACVDGYPTTADDEKVGNAAISFRGTAQAHIKTSCKFRLSKTK